MLATVEPWHGKSIVVYAEQPGVLVARRSSNRSSPAGTRSAGPISTATAATSWPSAGATRQTRCRDLRRRSRRRAQIEDDDRRRRHGDRGSRGGGPQRRQAARHRRVGPRDAQRQDLLERDAPGGARTIMRVRTASRRGPPRHHHRRRSRWIASGSNHLHRRPPARPLLRPPADVKGVGGRVFPQQQRPPGDPALIERGRTLYSVTCSACHGVDARGGQLGGPNLLRSQLVLADQDGEAIVPVVQKGRPDKGMPPVPIHAADAKAVVEYLHSLLAAAGRQGSPPPTKSRRRTSSSATDGRSDVLRGQVQRVPLADRRSAGHRRTSARCEDAAEPVGLRRDRRRSGRPRW